MNRFQILDWDTAFFGVTTARILPTKLTAGELAQIIASLRKGNVALAYWASISDDEESQQAARLCHGFLADKKVTFVVEIGHVPETSDNEEWVVEKYVDTLPNSELEFLAIQAGIYSRFKVDPQIPAGKFADLYKLWIWNSVNRQIADAVLVVRRSGKIVGMVTVGEKNGRGDIGLIAVDASMRGKNLGVSLVHAAQEWARGKGFRFAQVATQGENLSACKLYEKCGYMVDKVENVYHFWM